LESCNKKSKENAIVEHQLNRIVENAIETFLKNKNMCNSNFEKYIFQNMYIIKKEINYTTIANCKFLWLIFVEFNYFVTKHNKNQIKVIKGKLLFYLFDFLLTQVLYRMRTLNDFC
jgi:hypothetical protein